MERALELFHALRESILRAEGLWSHAHAFYSRADWERILVPRRITLCPEHWGMMCHMCDENHAECACCACGALLCYDCMLDHREGLERCFGPAFVPGSPTNSPLLHEDWNVFGWQQCQRPCGGLGCLRSLVPAQCVAPALHARLDWPHSTHLCDLCQTHFVAYDSSVSGTTCDSLTSSSSSSQGPSRTTAPATDTSRPDDGASNNSLWSPL
jgi:hypothetical protein